VDHFADVGTLEVQHHGFVVTKRPVGLGRPAW